MPLDQSASDAELIKQIQKGYISAFELLLTRYERPIRAFIHRYIQDPSDVDDIAQDTFISIYRSIERIDTKRKFSSYLFTSAKNTAYSFLRKAKKVIPIGDKEYESEEDLYETLSTHEQEVRVQKILQLLESKYRTVLLLFYFDGLSYDQIAKKLRVPVNTIRTHLSRAKAFFRRAYGQTA